MRLYTHILRGDGVDLHAAKHFRPGHWCSNNRNSECSLFTIGKTVQHRTLPSLRYLLRMLRYEIF